MDKPEPNADVQSLDLDNPSAFESILKTVGLGGYGVRNILKGNIEGAGRNLVDLISSPLRAVLPGDQSSWEMSRQEDLPEFSELIGGMEPGLGKTAVDVLGGIATDPLSFLGVGEFSAAAKAAKAANAAVKVARASGDVAKLAEAAKASEVANTALKASRAAGETKTALGVGLPFQAPIGEIPGSARGLELAGQGLSKITPPIVSDIGKQVGHGLRKTFAALKPSDKIAEDVASAEALGSTTRLAGQTYPVGAFADVPEDIQRRAIETLRGVSSELGPEMQSLGIEAAQEFVTKPEQMALIEQRLAKMPWDDGTKQAVRDTAEKIVDYTRGKFSEGIENKVFSPAPAADLAKRQSAEMWRQVNAPQTAPMSIPKSAVDLAPADYFPGRYEVPGEEDIAASMGRPGMPAPIKKAKIRTSEDLASYLNNTGGKLEGNLPKILGQYGEQMGSAAAKASIGAKTVGNDFTALVDPASRAAVGDAIDKLRTSGDLDSAHVLETAFKGLPPPGPIMRTLSKLNAPFKASATAGILVPNLNFTISNTISNVVQAIQNPEARGVAMKSFLSLPRVIGGSIADGLKRIGISAFPESDYEQVVAAARRSGGRRDKMLEMIENPRLRSAVEHGVLDGGFVSAEQLGTDFATKGTPKNWKNLAYWTQDIAKGSEQRMRYGMYNDLIDAGKSEKDAARIVDDTLFNYKYSSVANRNARQLIPFGAYTFKATPQAAKFIAEKPAMLPALNALYSQNDANTNPLPPWTQGNVNIAVGKGESGNPQYLTSLRLPFEQLGNIPNPSGDLGDFLSQTRQDIVGQSSPLLKTAIGALSGVDPRTGQPFMGNDRTPALFQSLGAPERSELSRKYNALASTGAPIVAQVAATVNTLGKLLDKRQSIPVAALNSLTGFKIIDVDEQQALRQITEDAIRRDPTIKTAASYYQLQKTPEGQALLKKLQEIRKQLKAQKAAAK